MDIKEKIIQDKNYCRSWVESKVDSKIEILNEEILDSFDSFDDSFDSLDDKLSNESKAGVRAQTKAGVITKAELKAQAKVEFNKLLNIKIEEECLEITRIILLCPNINNFYEYKDDLSRMMCKKIYKNINFK